MTSTLAAQIVAYGTCLFLAPFYLAAILAPSSRLSLGSIGLAPSGPDPAPGLSNIRGTVGGLRLAIIAMIVLGVSAGRPDLSLAAAVTVGAVASGRFVSLALDGWNWLSFATAAGEVVIVLSLLHLGDFI